MNDAMSIEGCKINYSTIIGGNNVFRNNRAFGWCYLLNNMYFHIQNENGYSQTRQNSNSTLFVNNSAIIMGGAILFDIPDRYICDPGTFNINEKCSFHR